MHSLRVFFLGSAIVFALLFVDTLLAKQPPSVTVKTHPSISLIKYWGKRNEELMLPTKSSFSIGLQEMTTTTQVEVIEAERDEVLWEGGSLLAKMEIMRFLDFFRRSYAIDWHFRITTHNNFPTGAGLSSSSSGYAALALALNAVCDLQLSPQEISALARRGSGSAARAVYGGFVLWHKGEKDDGSDCYAEPFFPPHYWPELRVIVVINEEHIKEVSSRIAGRRVLHAPSYQEWIQKAERRLDPVVHAVIDKDLHRLGKLMEEEWEDFHRVSLEANPPLRYWNEASYAVIDKVRQLRDEGYTCYITTDAGANVKIFCLATEEEALRNRLKEVSGIQSMVTTRVADGPQVDVHLHP